MARNLQDIQRLLMGQFGQQGGGEMPEMPLPDTSEQIYISSLALIKMLKHGFPFSISFSLSFLL